MRVRKLSELTPEQIEELRCPMPSMKMLEKTIDLGVGELVFEGIEEALIPARALMEFRQAMNITTLTEIINIQAADFAMATTMFVYRVIASKGFFKNADEVFDKMTAAQIKHAFALAKRICYDLSDGMPKESADFFSKAQLIQQLTSAEDFLNTLNRTNQETSLISIVIRALFERMNEICDQLKMEKLDLQEVIQSGASSDESVPFSSSSTDSAEAEPPVKPSNESTNTTSV